MSGWQSSKRTKYLLRSASVSTDVVKDEEAYDNDALRMVEYEAYGKRALPMTPVRFGSYGDPPVVLSKPIGYHTAEFMHDSRLFR